MSWGRQIAEAILTHLQQMAPAWHFKLKHNWNDYDEVEMAVLRRNGVRLRYSTIWATPADDEWSQSMIVFYPDKVYVSGAGRSRDIYYDPGFMQHIEKSLWTCDRA